MLELNWLVAVRDLVCYPLLRMTLFHSVDVALLFLVYTLMSAVQVLVTSYWIILGMVPSALVNSLRVTTSPPRQLIPLKLALS